MEAMSDDERRINPKKQKLDTSGRRRCSQQVPEPGGSSIGVFGAGKVRLPSPTGRVKGISKIIYSALASKKNDPLLHPNPWFTHNLNGKGALKTANISSKRRSSMIPGKKSTQTCDE